VGPWWFEFSARVVGRRGRTTEGHKMLLKAHVRAARSSRQPQDGALRFDRRCEYRESGSGRVVATYRNADGHAGLTWVEIVDTSDNGIGLRSPIAIEPGASVFLHSGTGGKGQRVGFHSGMVALAVTCSEQSETESGFRIGLRIGRHRAA